MSLYGAFDYLDVLSRGSIMAPRREEEEEEEEGEAVLTPATEEEDEDYLLVLDDAAAATTVAESAEESTLPSEIHVSSFASSNYSSSSAGAGATILPSLPSEEVAAALLEQQRLQALSMQVQAAPRVIARNATSTISLSTTESRFTDVVHEVDDDDDPSTVSSLSLSMMSSVPSSTFSQDFSVPSSAGSYSSSPSSASTSDDESTKVMDINESKPPSRPPLTQNLSHKGPWYSNLKTEQDWEAFRTECYTIMEAMGEDAPKDPDAMLAQLIAQEEEMLYTRKKTAPSFLGLSYETIAMVAGAALVPLVGYAFLSRNRREKSR